MVVLLKRAVLSRRPVKRVAMDNNTATVILVNMKVCAGVVANCKESEKE